MLYSYDVFDTIITRITNEPIGVFDLLQDWIEKKYGKVGYGNNFSKIRCDAEKYAYRLYGSKTDIYMIYELVSRMNGVNEKVAQGIMQAELDIEYRCSIPIEKTIKEITKLVERGERVVLISDMYMSGTNIRKLLTKHSAVFENIPIYVSNEIGATKNEGLIYKYVKERENVEYNEWIHCGDNVRSDIIIPGLLGIKTQIIEDLGIDSIASATLKNIKKDGLLDEQIFSKMIKKRMKSIEYGIGFCQSGPILYDYVRWILDMCEKFEKKRLFFIARDGYVLKKIADIIIQSKDLDVSTSYIYGSRKVWRVEGEDDKRLVKDYFKQVLDNNYEKFALVDMQGTGISCDYVSDIIECDFPVFVYYLISGNEKPRCTTYIYSFNNDGINIMECLCRAPHGTTTGYKRKEDLVTPILEDEGNTEETYRAIEEHCEGVWDFAAEVCRVENILDIKINLKSISSAISKTMNANPNIETANFLGDIIHSHNNVYGKKFAPMLSENEIVSIASDVYKYNGTNLNISLLRSGERVSKIYNETRSKLLNEDPRGYKDNSKYKIILYGAGKRGKEVYTKYNNSEDVEIVAWVDLNYELLSKEGLHVSNPSAIKNVDMYDYVVVGIATNNKVIEQYLVETGVPVEKIISSDKLNRMCE